MCYLGPRGHGIGCLDQVSTLAWHTIDISYASTILVSTHTSIPFLFVIDEILFIALADHLDTLLI